MRVMRVIAVIVIFGLSACSLFDPHYPYTERLGTPKIVRVEAHQDFVAEGVFRVATLNTAHGRKASFHQLFLGASTIRKNLLDIAEFLNQTKPLVVALQETDGPSFWSGGFDHVAYLAAKANFPWHVRSEHVQNIWGRYGTGFLSRTPIVEASSLSFSPSPPTSRKGFTAIKIMLKGKNNERDSTPINVLSVHLDFSRQSVRNAQVEEIKRFMTEKSGPTVIMGDMNSHWLSKKSVVQKLIKNSRFSAYKEESEVYPSYGKKRLDWILISEELEFVDYYVFDGKLSDHYSVVAQIKLKESIKTRIRGLGGNGEICD